MSDTLAEIAKKNLKTQLETAMMSTSGTDNSAEFQVKENQTPEADVAVHANCGDELPLSEPMRAPGRGRPQYVGVVGTNNNETEGFKGFNNRSSRSPAKKEEIAVGHVVDKESALDELASGDKEFADDEERFIDQDALTL